MLEFIFHSIICVNSKQNKSIFLKILKEIKDSNRTQDEINLWDDHKLNIPEGKESDSLKDERLFVHKNFRLWLVTESDYVSNIPESLIYDAVKLMPQVSDLKQTYLTCKENLLNNVVSFVRISRVLIK